MFKRNSLCKLEKQKSLTDFFKQNRIKFSRVKTNTGEIITTTDNFPRLCFHYEPDTDYVTVWKVAGEGYTRSNGEYVQVFRSYAFPCQSCYRVMAKLLQYRLITIGQLKRLRI